MMLHSCTQLADKNGFLINLGQQLVSPSGRIYQVIDDNDFGYSITYKGVVEKLYPEVAKSMEHLPFNKRWKEIQKVSNL